jgi:hypothetical protein
MPALSGILEIPRLQAKLRLSQRKKTGFESRCLVDNESVGLDMRDLQFLGQTLDCLIQVGSYYIVFFFFRAK